MSQSSAAAMDAAGIGLASKNQASTLGGDAAGISLASMWVGFIAFAVAALLGFYQVIVRIDLIPALKSPALYFGSVSTHGVLMGFVLTTFLIMGYGYYTATTSLKQDLWSKPLAWFGFWLAVVGVLLAAGPLLTGNASVLYTFYPPLMAHPAFYIGATLLVVEGSGEGDTHQNYRELGYRKVPADELIDLDLEETGEYEDPEAERFPRIQLPRLIMDGFLISIPVLKDHSCCGVTLSIKNMVGVLPASRYSGYMSYKKSEVHNGDLDQAIADICRYRSPDLALIDGRIGMKGSHLAGTPCTPPKRVLIGGRNPWTADAAGARALGWNPEEIGHLQTTEQIFLSR